MIAIAGRLLVLATGFDLIIIFLSDLGTTWVTNSIAYLDVNIWTEYISRYGDT